MVMPACGLSVVESRPHESVACWWWFADKLVLRMMSLRDKKRFVLHSFKVLMPPSSPRLKPPVADAWLPAAAMLAAPPTPAELSGLKNGGSGDGHDGAVAPAARASRQAASAGRSQMDGVRGMLQELTKPGQPRSGM